MVHQETREPPPGLRVRRTALRGVDLVEILRGDDDDERAEPVGGRVAEKRAEMSGGIGSHVQRKPCEQDGRDGKAQPVLLHEPVSPSLR